VQVPIDHIICSDMALSTTATKFHKILGVLGIARIAALFGVAGRTVRSPPPARARPERLPLAIQQPSAP
jgi:hypothetical protein